MNSAEDVKDNVVVAGDTRKDAERWTGRRSYEVKSQENRLTFHNDKLRISPLGKHFTHDFF